nr:hypothetical protein [Tanacetum cinerariifolium]
MGTYNQVAPQNRASNYMAPPGFVPVQNSQNRYNQGQRNNFNQGNSFHGNQPFQVPKQGFQNQPFQVPNNQVQQGLPNEFSSYKKANDQMIRNIQNKINSLKGKFKNEIQNTMKTQQTILMNQQNAFQNNLQNMLSGFFQNQASTLGTLPSNNNPNPKGEMKEITTRSGVDYEGPSIPTNPSPKKVVERENEETTDKEQTNLQGSTAYIQPPVTPIQEPDVPKTLPKPNIPYPLRINDQKLREKATNQMENRSSGTPHFREILLGIGRALIDIYGEEITLWFNDEAVTFNLNQTTRYSSTYDDLSVNRIDIIDVTKEDDNASFSNEDILKEIYSNPMFDEEIISMKIDPHHFNANSDLIESLLNHDSSIISSSSKIDSLFDELTGELIFLKSIPPVIDETECDPEEEIHLIKKLLYDNSSPRPSKEFISENSDAEIESFSPSPILVEDSDSLMEEIDLTLTPDDSIPPSIKDDDYDSERDILILEKLLNNDSISLPENESFHFDISSSLRPPAKPPNDDLGILNVKVMGDISEHNVPMTRHLLISYLTGALKLLSFLLKTR